MRTVAVVLAIGILLLALGAPVVVCAAFAFVAPVAAAAAPRVQVRCAEQPLALRALVAFRAPPSLA